ncbi:DNA internalization-related competence protein ComEC/Rec2 [Paraherbaspirillum soli]|uniref:DNA internalization-related competence protein ComEC/Rec2 n=1 Tax=Paraherbaspirillum soli TaxID=631222 RepID=A0ABW0MD93_9BURK
MRCAIIGFAIGVGYLQIQAALPSSLALVALLALAVLCALAARKMARHAVAMPALLLCGALFGFSWAALFAQHYLQQELPPAWEGRDVTVIGTVDSLPSHVEQGVRFTFAVEKVLPQDGVLPTIPSRLSLAWYRGFAQAGRPSSAAAMVPAGIEPGARWQLTVRLKRPHGNANPYGFDYEVWLLEKNLRATGYVRADQATGVQNRQLDPFVFSVQNAIDAGRGWLRRRILTALPGRPYAGVLVALVIGDQQAIDQSDWEIFNRTGISHLVSISGLHITMIAGLFAALMSALWRRSFFTDAGLPLYLPAQKVAALSGALAALLYVLLAGFGVPAQRTLYMLSVVALAMWSGRIASVSHVLCVALGVVLLLDPWAVLWPGFWLSFFAVGMILYGSVGRTTVMSDGAQSARRKWLASLKAGAYTQYVVTIGLVPLTMLLFARVSLVSPLANALAIPLVGLVVTPLALVGSVLPAPLCGWLLMLAHALVELLAMALGWLSKLPHAVWQAALPPPWIFLTALLATLWWLAPRGWPLRWLALAGWIPLLLHGASRPADGEIWVTALDVGQGMALLVETPGHRLLYDTGPYYSPQSDAGSMVILPWLKARGINYLDALVISHADSDHAGGGLSVLDSVPVAALYSSLSPEHPIVRSATEHRPCHAGQAWQWDGVQFEMLHPSPESYDDAAALPKMKPNTRSCVLKISNRRQSILLAGDIEAAQERQLIASHRGQLKASVLLAPHHGSGTSSTPAFLREVEPQIALFQVGYRNRYRHPKQEVFERYQQLGIATRRSDEAGAIFLRFGDTVEASEYRTEHKRYWYGR